jgi:hypothetical protein
MDFLEISYIVVPILVIIFTILIIITYTNDDFFKKTTSGPKDTLKLYPYYFNIFFCVNIALYCLVRLIPKELTIENFVEGQETFLCRFQAFMGCLLEKLLLFLMTSYSIVNYLSVFKSDLYKTNLKKIYLALTLMSLLFSLSISIAFYLEGISQKDVLCSIHTRILGKIISDGILTGILIIINLFCLISIIYNLVKLAKKYDDDNNFLKYKKSVDFIKRFILDTIFTFLTFGYTLLVVCKVFPPGTYKDIIYIIFCQMVEIVFTINESLFKAFIRLITCNKYYKFTPTSEKLAENDDEENPDNLDNPENPENPDV